MADDAPIDRPDDAPPVGGDDSQQNGAPADDHAGANGDGGGGGGGGDAGAPAPDAGTGEEVKLYVGNLDYGKFPATKIFMIEFS